MHPPALSPDEQRLLAPLADRRDAIVATVLDWCAVNSGSRNLAGLEAMADRLAAAMARLGGTPTLHDPAPADAVDASGVLRPLPHGRNLHLSLRPDVERRVVLVGHMDTVFPADHPFQTCRWLDERTINGPGTADMKGGIAVMLAAVQAFEASPFAPLLGLDIVIVADEEVSSLGSAPLLARVAARCGIGLCYEPAMTPEGTLAGARKGSGNFSLIVTGRSAHAGRNPQDGRNALLAAAELALGLEAINGGRPGLTCNPARIDGGSANNVVPDGAVLRFNIRVREAQDQDWALKRIAALQARVETEREVKVALHGGFYRPPKPMTPRQTALFELARRCGHDLGLAIEWRESGGVCDGNNLAALGLSVIDTLGVRGGAIHSPDEYVLTDSLVERAQLSALLLARIARGEP
jgi:glutamate carboxypeptidase